MAPIAALFDSKAPTEKGVHVFYVTQQNNLGLACRHAGLHGKDSQDVWAADEKTFKGIVQDKSEIGAAIVDGVRFVVAMTNHKPESSEALATLNDVSIVSPIYQVLASTALGDTTMAIASSDDEGWVYYLTCTNAGEVEVNEYELSSGNRATFKGLNVVVDCSLGAYYDKASGKRFIIFQERGESHLKEYNIDTKQSVDILDTAGAGAKTSLCVTYSDGIAYLYYTDEYLNVYRVVKKQGSWGNRRNLFNEKPGANSQMAVVTANGANHVFFQTENSTKIAHCRDDAPSNGTF
ncbi:hypothetical protein F5144DRAFT_650484 [Chaetomium tenue]|uniref:Uncharacterized protein n=1 Tax=Chaetomium tenue TaxID=1854479 RepID=A0ACB7P8X7_9PEZI|nr:hypothetical protein F5144DRAFT_650484 [Chaetomium globosum]